MVWSFSVYTNLSLVFQHSHVHHSLVVLHWLLHPFWFLGHHLLQKLLHCNLAKVLLFAIAMQVQRTITARSLLSWIKSSRCMISRIVSAFHIIPLVHVRVFLDLLYSISHKNFKSFCGASDICKHHPTICVQNLSVIFPRFNFFLIKHAIFTDSTAAVNSSLVVDKNFFGVTLDFQTSKLQCIFSSSFTNRMWPYPLSEASEKWWRLVSSILETCKAWCTLICVYLEHFLISVPIFPNLSWALVLQHHPIAQDGCIGFEAIAFLQRQMDLQVLMGHRLN